VKGSLYPQQRRYGSGEDLCGEPASRPAERTGGHEPATFPDHNVGLRTPHGPGQSRNPESGIGDDDDGPYPQTRVYARGEIWTWWDE
jgi:hypothetical protein